VKKILAVSGGIDSMVLLERFFRDEPENIVVAHFNHGTRTSADLDEQFVFSRCKELKVPFETMKIMLGEGVSEELARQKRYDFLYHVANKYGGEIYTAHHLDDLIESIAINLIRGTGWRGLTPFSDNRIHRPFIERGFYKTDILRFAAENKVLFREDPTNSTDDYLRNRVRSRLLIMSRVEKKRLIDFYKRQAIIRHEVEELCGSLFNFLLIKDSSHEINGGVDLHGGADFTSVFSAKSEALSNIKIRKDFFLGNSFLGNNENYTEETIEEVLRFICEKIGVNLTRVQLKDFLRAIRTYGTNKKFNLPKDKMAVIGRDFIGF
jgi:tRNA(ile)-lysidine synthetase